MADVPANIHEQTLSRLSSVGAQAHEHFQQFNKILDLEYEADRKMVSLVESLGVREVTSRSGQEGIPIAATINKP
jgi:nicotinic acid phosphoribosyltransferase